MLWFSACRESRFNVADTPDILIARREFIRNPSTWVGPSVWIDPQHPHDQEHPPAFDDERKEQP